MSDDPLSGVTRVQRTEPVARPQRVFSTRDEDARRDRRPRQQADHRKAADKPVAPQDTDGVPHIDVQA